MVLDKIAITTFTVSILSDIGSTDVGPITVFV